ncbi:GrdX family protein [Photobacterium kagoshimensis]|uniref:GrdX family protein n=1 Tax=Photobacterium kagoshimensis TaxID=2910242 RepID=UPI003D0C027D
MRADRLEIITNNPSLKVDNSAVTIIRKNTVNDVLTFTRDQVHLGYKVISHPLAGSVKPHETPYRSIVIYRDDSLDMDSLNTIEQTIERYQVLCKSNPDFIQLTSQDIERDFPIKQRSDFQFIDFQLIKSCLSAINASL